LAKTNIIQNALRGDKPPRLHGLVYDIADGVLKDLEMSEQLFLHDMAHIYSTQVHVPLAQDERSDTYDGPQHDPSQTLTA
jgi:carbonic anhydrase